MQAINLAHPSGSIEHESEKHNRVLMVDWAVILDTYKWHFNLCLHFKRRNNHDMAEKTGRVFWNSQIHIVLFSFFEIGYVF